MDESQGSLVLNVECIRSHVGKLEEANEKPCGDEWRVFKHGNGWEEAIDVVRVEVEALGEEVCEQLGRQGAYLARMGNEVERVRYLVLNQQIEDLPTKALKKELKKRKKNRRGL